MTLNHAMSIQVYPNPVNGVITLHVESLETTVNVLSADGKCDETYGRPCRKQKERAQNSNMESRNLLGIY